jgi:DNA-binding beta-propeller fold protein YncE
VIRRHRTDDDASTVTKENHTVTRLTRLAVIAALASFATLLAAGPAMAAEESHPFVSSFGSFTNPNGIAVDESSGDVYVADLGTNTVSKFDASGASVESWGTKGVLDGTTTPAGSFAFPNEPGNPAAIAVDNSTSPPDPSAGDLYVLDAGHKVIDKFNADGEALTPITGPFSFPPLGVGVDASGNVRVDVRGEEFRLAIDVFDDAAVNGFVKLLTQASAQTSGGTQVYGFATARQPGSDYPLLSCGCVAKLGPNGEQLGRVDGTSTAVAVAVDPRSGHVFVDDQSSVTEFDTGEMNGSAGTGFNASSSGTRVLSFGSPQLTGSSGQGGIAVNGASGKVYVSNPADGKVYVFAGSSAPVAVANATGSVTQTGATLLGTVDPHGLPLTSCRFDYATTPALNLTLPIVHLGQSVPCVGEHGEPVLGNTSPLAVHADVSGLTPGSLYHFRLVAENASDTSFGGGLFATASAGFGIKQFEVAFLNQDGTPDTQAGSHPYEMVTTIIFNTQVVPRSPDDLRYGVLPQGNVKDVTVHLPAGFYGDPNATAKKCTLVELSSGGLGDLCPAESELGQLEAEYRLGSELGTSIAGSRLLSIVPPPGVPFQIAAHIAIPNAFINVGVPAGGDSGLTATSEGIPVTVPVFRSTLKIFGVPPHGGTKPLLTMPTSCNGPLTSTISADSYQEPGRFATATSLTRDATGQPAGMSGCSQLIFPPTITGAPDVTDASSPTGFTGSVHISQKAASNPTGLAEANLRDATVTLPEGITLNPGGADGLEGCSEAQAGFTEFTEFNPDFEPGDQTAAFTPDLPQPLLPGANFCPDGSKIGTVRVQTPLLTNPIEGSIYLATPYQNPFNSLLAIYLIAEDPVSGTIIKQVGHVTADPSSGQLVTTFHNTPNDPVEEVNLHFFGGNRAPLVTPSTCGEYTTEAVFTPWSGTGPVSSGSSFTIDHGQNGGPCPSGGAPPFHPGLNAGTRSSTAGSYSPLDLELTRGDSEQEFTHFSVKLPPGLAGKIAGIPLCSDAAIAAAKARTGAHGGTEEEEHPSCPAASEVGHTLVGAGVGSVLVWVPGKIYLAGAYHGSPLSVVAITSARAGAFDFGTVVVRQALRINPETAEVFVDSQGSDPLPHIIQGVPTHLRKILIYLDRPEFTFNPTSCEPTSIASTVLGSGASFTSEADDVPVVASSPFQASDCRALPFKPKLKLSLNGAAKRTGNPAFKAKLTMKPGEANIARSVVTLPRSEFLDNSHIRTVCTKSVYNQGAVPGERCPPSSIYGHARALSPILDEPLEGPVFLRTPGGKLPDLVAALHSQKVNITLVGHIDSLRSKTKSGEAISRIRNTFAAVPDAPVSSFVLEMQGGNKGLLENSTNLCRGTHRAEVEFTGHNGKQANSTPAVGASCGKKHKAGKRHSHRAAR